jgi:hypothetical protein
MSGEHHRPHPPRDEAPKLVKSLHRKINSNPNKPNHFYLEDFEVFTTVNLVK